MKLTDGEKLILLMLADVQEKLQIRGEIEPDFVRTAIFHDHLWGLNWKYSGIPFDSAEDPPIVREVMDILDMWSFIEFAYDNLDDAQKRDLTERTATLRELPRFEGFDGNNETEYMSVAMFIVNQLERFENFKGRAFNCHHPSIDIHRRMLSAFTPMRANLTAGRLSVDQLAAILRERVHPSRRDA